MTLMADDTELRSKLDEPEFEEPEPIIGEPNQVDPSDPDQISNSRSAAGTEPGRANPPGGADTMLKVSHFGLLAGLCEFIPVPFADDAAQSFVRKHMVTRVLAWHGRDFNAEAVPALYKGVSGGFLSTVGSIGTSIVMKPVKKVLRTVFFWLLIRKAVLEAAETLLMGHTLDRLLSAGELGDELSPGRRRDRAESIFKSVNQAWGSADIKMIKRLVRRSGRLLRPGKDNQGPPPASTGEDVPGELKLPEDQQRRLRSAAADLRNRMETPEGKSALARFDADVDRRLAALSKA